MPPIFQDYGIWLKFNESIKSTTAIMRGLNNTPGSIEYVNMQKLYREVYAPLCDHYGRKLPINSMYRSPSVNKAVGGATDSAHMLGLAVDIDCDGLIGQPTNRQLFDYVIASGMPFDQIIMESPDAQGRPQWVHIGLSVAHPYRHDKFIMNRGPGGKPQYNRIP